MTRGESSLPIMPDSTARRRQACVRPLTISACELPGATAQTRAMSLSIAASTYPTCRRKHNPPVDRTNVHGAEGYDLTFYFALSPL